MPCEWDTSDGKQSTCPHTVTIRSRKVGKREVVEMAKQVMDGPGSAGHFWFEREDTRNTLRQEDRPVVFHVSDENTAFEFKLRNG